VRPFLSLGFGLFSKYEWLEKNPFKARDKQIIALNASIQEYGHDDNIISRRKADYLERALLSTITIAVRFLALNIDSIRE
jgi:hypothetical protein